MTDDRWIVVSDWETFQHYRDRTPPWIKNYTALLHNDAYLDLTPVARSLLHGVWLAYALSDGQLRARHLSALKLSHRRHHLEALNDAGFIRFRASKPLAKRYKNASPRARPRARGEAETETEKKITKRKAKPSNTKGEPERITFAEYLEQAGAKP